MTLCIMCLLLFEVFYQTYKVTFILRKTNFIYFYKNLNINIRAYMYKFNKIFKNWKDIVYCHVNYLLFFETFYQTCV